MNFDALGWGNYLLFVVLAVIIVFSSITVSYIVDTLGKRTKFSGALVAGTLVAFVSSLPEFTSSLVAVLATHDFTNASGNLVGGNIFRTFALAIACIMFIYCMKKAKTTSIQVFLICVQILVSTVFLLSMFFHGQIEAVTSYIFLATDLFVILTYAATIFFMVKKDKNEEEGMKAQPSINKVRKFLMKIKISHVMLIFLACSLLIIGSAFCIALSTDWIKDSWGMGSKSGKSAFGSSILLGIVTSIPEIVTVITLLKLRNVDAAITDILGSNLFSLVIMGFIDLITIMDHEYTMWGSEGSTAINILFWFAIEVIFIGGLLLVNYIYRKKTVKSKWYYTWVIVCLVGVLVCYIISLFQESGLIPKVYPDPVASQLNLQVLNLIC